MNTEGDALGLPWRIFTEEEQDEISREIREHRITGHEVQSFEKCCHG
jgi:hypothetical protein